MRRLLALILFGTAATASAQPNANLPQNRQPQTEERYQPRNQLADVSLPLGRERTVIQLPRTGRQIDYLELRAGRAKFTLLDVEVRFADGRTMHTGDRGLVEGYEGRVVDLPRRSAAPTMMIVTYRTIARQPSRLQVFGVRQHRPDRSVSR